MVTWKEFAAAEHDLAATGRYALQSFPQPKPGSDEFYITGKAVLVDDQKVARALGSGYAELASLRVETNPWRTVRRSCSTTSPICLPTCSGPSDAEISGVRSRIARAQSTSRVSELTALRR